MQGYPYEIGIRTVPPSTADLSTMEEVIILSQSLVFSLKFILICAF